MDAQNPPLNDQPSGTLNRWQRWRLGVIASKLRSVINRGFPGTLLELAIIVGWTYYITRPLLNLNPNSLPYGREFVWGLESNYAWRKLVECGACMFWNGNFEGGTPAFANPLSSFLHPLAAVPTMIFGILNGGKIALASAFLLTGLSQWLLGKYLGAGRIARTWAAMMAVISGHLAARMELGAFGTILSTATFSLVLAFFIRLHKNPGGRSIVLLAGSLAVLAVGGQGYLQAGTAFALIIVLIMLRLFFLREDFSRLFRAFSAAVVLAFLLAGPFIIPFTRFLPLFGKNSDPNFETAQPLDLAPLNLVIDDFSFYQTDALSKEPFPSHYVLYIGWIPILLSLVVIRERGPKRQYQQYLILAGFVFAGFWIGSGAFLKILVDLSPFDWLDNFVAGLRFPALIASISVPPLLGLSAAGLDHLIKLDSPNLVLGYSENASSAQTFSISLKWIILWFLFVGLRDAYHMNHRFFETIQVDPAIYRVVRQMRTENSEWVNVPFGANIWVGPALESGLKLGFDFNRTWHWMERPYPAGYFEASFTEPREGMELVNTLEGVQLHRAVGGPAYALVYHPDGTTTPCAADSNWGNIDVTCSTVERGNLIVTENNYSGWKAYVNNQRAALEEYHWLQTPVPAGETTVSFRYRPWDVPAGLLLLLAGLVVSYFLWNGESAAVQRFLQKPPQRPDGEPRDISAIDSQ